MRIAQLANFISPTSGGIRVALEALGQGYLAHGHHRLLIVPGERDEIRRDGANTVAVVASPRVAGGYRMIVNLVKVAKILNEFAPDVLEISDKWTLVALTRWAKRRTIPTVLLSHERLDDMASDYSGCGLVRGFVLLWNRVLARRFDQIVVTSDYSSREWGHTYAVLTKVSLGVDLDTFTPGAGLGAERARGGVRPPYRACYVGRMSHEKYPQLAVATLAELHGRGVPIELHMYGTGADLEALRSQAQSHPVFFHGFVAGREAVAQCYRDADLTFSMCPTETFGLAPLESLACGTPVVAVNGSGASETLDSTSGEIGDGDAASLADAVERLIARLGTDLRHAARARAEQFPWSATVERMLQVYCDLSRR